MRLLHAMAGARVGGAETFFTRLVPALQRAGQDQRVLMRPNAAREAVLAAAGTEIKRTRFGARLDPLTALRFRREIAGYDPDIVLTWMNRATAHCPPKRPRRNFVHLGTPRGYYQIKYYRRCDHLVCATRSIAEYFIAEGWPRDRITAIPNFAPDMKFDAASRRELDTPEGAPLLLALGRLHVNKGFDVLLAALAELPDHYLWLGGSGPLEGSLKKLARSLGVAPRVRFLGWRDDTQALLAAADVFVCSSRHEPFGNIIIEAWAQGIPVVAAASSGPGALIEDGASGLLAPVDDAASLAGAVRRVADEPGLIQVLATGGRAAFERDYCEKLVVRRYMDLFQRLAG
ncbi:MAG: glycosyltransferase [Alphaproteobacteria bacterium]